MTCQASIYPSERHDVEFFQFPWHTKGSKRSASRGTVHVHPNTTRKTIGPSWLKILTKMNRVQDLTNGRVARNTIYCEQKHREIIYKLHLRDLKLDHSKKKIIIIMKCLTKGWKQRKSICHRSCFLVENKLLQSVITTRQVGCNR